MEFDNLVKLAIDYYDIQCKKYKSIINDHESLFHNDFNYLGEYNRVNNIWTWFWSIVHSDTTYDYNKEDNRLNVLNKINKGILNYGLDIDPNESAMMFKLKIFIVNSASQFTDSITFNIYIALISYILRDKIKCIYKRTWKAKDDIIRDRYYCIL